MADRIITKSGAARFWKRVDKMTPPDGCWLWTGAQHRRGYGNFKVEKRNVGAHRFAWELERGPIPDGRFVCHRCDNPRCVRVDHLFLGTHAQNMADMYAKGRRRVRLTAAAVTEIRALRAGSTLKVLAERFGVSDMAVHQAATRKTWRHVVP